MTIYEYLKKMFDKDIDNYSFKHDYINDPLTIIQSNQTKIPYKEDLEYLYINLDLKLTDLASIFRCSTGLISKWLRNYKISKRTFKHNKQMIDESFYTIHHIDVSKLKRDYIKNPLIKTINGKGNELPYKEDIEYLYFDINLSQKEMCQYFGIGKTCLTNWKNKLGITHKDYHLAYKHNISTNIKKYGVDNPSSLDMFKQKRKQTIDNKIQNNPDYYNDIVIKSKQTKLQRYNDPNYCNIEKAKETNRQKYGNNCSLHCEENQEKSKQTKLIKYNDINYNNRNKMKNTKRQRYNDPNYCNIEKAKETNRQKYGVNYTLQNELVYQKARKTNKEKYGVEFYLQKDIPINSLNILHSKDKLKQFINNSPNKTYNYLAFVLKVSPSTIKHYIDEFNLSNDIQMNINKSSYEVIIKDSYPMFEQHNRTVLNGNEIDLYNDEFKIGVEINGNYWHNEYNKERLYHQDKSLLAESKGIFIYHIFEYEWNNKQEQIMSRINNLLHINQQRIYARKCQIKEVDNQTKSTFINNNHLQNDVETMINIGLFYNDSLVMIMSFNPLNNNEWELCRFCTLQNHIVIGGASKLFKHFITTYQPTSIISYSNLANGWDNIYNVLGFKVDTIIEPNYIWFKNRKVIQNIGQNVDEMHDNGYYRIYNAGYKKWVYEK